MTHHPAGSGNSSRVRRLRELDDLEVLDTRLVDHRFPLHFHDTFVLEWITAGGDRCDVSDLTARAGQLFVHGPRVPHSGAPASSEALSYQACYPSELLVAELLGLHVDALPHVGTLVLDGPSVRTAAERLFAALAAPAERDPVEPLRDVLRHVFAGGHRAAQVDLPRDAGLPPAVRRARDHLVAQLHRDVTTAELADVCGLSRYHLQREFKRVLQITPRQFLISQRVTEARRRIAAGQPLADVAYHTGFADQSHLTRSFKRVTALCPGQLKR